MYVLKKHLFARIGSDRRDKIVLPLELRETLNINIKDPLEIFVDGQSIILSKYEPACIFCSSVKDNVTFKGKIICVDCMDGIKGV